MLGDERMHHLSNRFMQESAESRNRLLSFFAYDYAKSFTEYIDQAVKSGQIDSRYPPEFVARVIEIMIANLHKFISTENPDELTDAADRVVNMIQHGISSK